MAVTVIQKDSDRYTFRMRTEDGNTTYSITHERMFDMGGAMSTEYTTKDDGNAFYKEKMAEGFHRFRSIDEVTWYATRPNNSPYAEIWETEGIYLIPIASRVLA